MKNMGAWVLFIQNSPVLNAYHKLKLYDDNLFYFDTGKYFAYTFKPVPQFFLGFSLIKIMR